MTRTTITYKGLSIRDPAPYGEAGLAWQNNFVTIADTLDSLQGSLDTALGGLVIGTDIQAYSANLDVWSGVAPSSDGQSLVAAVDYAAMRGLLGLGTMAAQAADAVAITGGVISGIADLAVADGGTGASDAAGARGNLGLAIGTDIQAYSANLDTWSSVAPSDNGKSLVSAADYAAMRGLLDLEPGTDVQAYSSRLGAIAALTPTDGNLIVGNGTTWVTQSGETARTTLGLGTLATQGAGSVAITGGTITGITDLAVADGGTGASDAEGARTNLGLGTIATQAANSVAITGGAINGTAIGATTPGTGSFTTLAATGRINLQETTSSTVGVVNIGGLRIHGFRHPTGDTARPDGNNVFIGPSAGNFTMGATATSTYHASRNTGIGFLVLSNLTTGYSNVAVGDRALSADTEGNENTALGQLALYALTTGSKNVGLGYLALYRLTTGYSNVAVGHLALSADTEGNENTALGQLALSALTTGTRNVGLGYYAGRYASGSVGNQTTSNSTYIGSLTRAFADGVTNETVIGYTAVGKGSNTVQIGNSSVTDTYLSGWLNLPSDTQGIKLDAAGTTTLISNGTVATLSKPLKAAGYQAADGSAGISKTITFKDADSVTHTLVFKDGLLTSHTEA